MGRRAPPIRACFHVGLQLPPQQRVQRCAVPRLRALLQALLCAAKLPELVQALVSVPLRLARLLSPPELPAMQIQCKNSLDPDETSIKKMLGWGPSSVMAYWQEGNELQLKLTDPR